MKHIKRLLCLLIALIVPTLIDALPIGYKLCQDSKQYNCYKVKSSDRWETLFKNAHDRDLVMRINRMNIPLYRGLHLAIPKDLSESDIAQFSPFPHQIQPSGQKMIIVSINPSTLAWGAYSRDGELEAWGPAVGARGYCPDIGRGCHTVLGHFNVYRKEGAGCISTKFPVPRGGAPMPWCMYFHGGFALHGSYELPGFNASHGCIRMLIPDAKWLNNNFVMDDKDVLVVITNNPY